MSDRGQCISCGCYLIKFEHVRAGVRAVCDNCGSCGPVRQNAKEAKDGWEEVCAMQEAARVNTDAYEDLRNTTPEELLEAVIWFTSQGINDPWQLKRTLSSLCRGFALAQPGGWERVAPMWLRESRKASKDD